MTRLSFVNSLSTSDLRRPLRSFSFVMSEYVSYLFILKDSSFIIWTSMPGISCCISYEILFANYVLPLQGGPHIKINGIAIYIIN